MNDNSTYGYQLSVPLSTAPTYYWTGSSYWNYSPSKCPGCGYCSCCGRDNQASISTLTVGYFQGKCPRCGYCSSCGRDDRPAGSPASPEE